MPTLFSLLPKRIPPNSPDSEGGLQPRIDLGALACFGTKQRGSNMAITEHR